MAMRKMARTALALVVSLVFLSLVASYSEYSKPRSYPGKPIPFEKLFGYNFGSAVVYGLFIYVPFIWLHARLLQRYSKGHWSTSVIIGGLLGSLSAVVMAILFALDDGEWGQTSQWLLPISAAFGLTGSLYGLLYHRWVVAKA